MKIFKFRDRRKARVLDVESRGCKAGPSRLQNPWPLPEELGRHAVPVAHWQAFGESESGRGVRLGDGGWAAAASQKMPAGPPRLHNTMKKGPKSLW